MRFAAGILTISSQVAAHTTPTAVCPSKEPEVIIVNLETPPPLLTNKLLAEWSQGFRYPTVVKNAFTNDRGCRFDYLADDVKIAAKYGQLGGFNEHDKAHFAWSAVREMLEHRSSKIYGSFGYGTGNHRKAHKRSIKAMKRRLAPNIFKGNTYPGHLIFGSTNETEVSTSWHNAIDANLLFQLCGTKEWWTMETLPPGKFPLQVTKLANGVVKQQGVIKSSFFELLHDDSLHHNEEWTPDLDRAATHFPIEPGDLLINPPFSWHAIKINQTSVSLSLRGDANDVIVWLSGKYFDGDINNPFLASFAAYFVDSYRKSFGFGPISAQRIYQRLKDWLFDLLFGISGVDLSYVQYMPKAWQRMYAYRAHFTSYQGEALRPREKIE